MKDIEQLLRNKGFTIEYVGEQSPSMYSFIAYTERHCIVATVFEAFGREEQCACATFNPNFLPEIRRRYGNLSRPGFDAYADVGSKNAIPDVPGPHNHDHSVFEIDQWLRRTYTKDSSQGKTATFS